MAAWMTQTKARGSCSDQSSTTSSSSSTLATARQMVMCRAHGIQKLCVLHEAACWQLNASVVRQLQLVQYREVHTCGALLLLLYASLGCLCLSSCSNRSNSSSVTRRSRHRPNAEARRAAS